MARRNTTRVIRSSRLNIKLSFDQIPFGSGERLVTINSRVIPVIGLEGCFYPAISQHRNNFRASDLAINDDHNVWQRVWNLQLLAAAWRRLGIAMPDTAVIFEVFHG